MEELRRPLDRTSATPAYVQLEDRIAALIARGTLQPGDRLPAERELAEWVGVSRMTARAALSSLADRGLLDRDVGRGTFVARGRVAHRLGELVSFTEMVRGQGLAATTRIRAVNELPAPDGVAAALELAPGAPAFRLQRVRLADGEPLTLEDSWVPAERFPGLLDQDLRGSLYALLRDVYDRPPARATERLEPVLATADDAAALGVTAGAPLMLVERVAYDAGDVPIEFARDLHRADRARFEVEVRAPALA